MGPFIIHTVSGRPIDLSNPDPANIDRDDIARSLSKLSRFLGHTLTVWGYSVAEHSVRMAWAATEKGYPDRVAFLCLIHDAHEAYIGDIPRPIRMMLGYTIEAVTKKLDDAIFEAFGFHPTAEEIAVCRALDVMMLATEEKDLRQNIMIDEFGEQVPTIPGVRIGGEPYTPAQSRRRWLEEWNRLSGVLKQAA